jgi:GNAT superfamily N-acetyltransferase
MKKMIDDIYIRDARTGDIPLMTQLLGELFSIEADFTADAGKQRKGLQMLLDTPGSSCLKVAVHLEEVVGMCAWHLQISTAQGEATLRIEDLIVARAFRRRGIGRELLCSVIEWGRTAGVHHTALLADAMNTPALDFYAACGWKQTQLVCFTNSISNKQNGRNITDFSQEAPYAT